MTESIPSPPFSTFPIGPLNIHIYGLMYVVGVVVAVWLTRRRWASRGGDPAQVDEVALWGVPAGIVGGRIYFDLTTPEVMPHTWWGPFAVWDGGMGIWGGVLLGALVGLWRLRRAGVDTAAFMDAVAPGIIIAQGIGRIGNYFNQELFGGPTTLPWGLEISPVHRPPGYEAFSTFQPTFLYELVFDLAWAGLLIWLGRGGRVKAPGLFALYIAGYSAFRIVEESLRIDYSQHFLGLRLNTFVATALLVLALTWFVVIQRRPRRQ